MKALYIGNFGPEHSTENHVKRALEANGVEVVVWQESPACWSPIPHIVPSEGIDFVMWTHTHGLSPESSHEDIWRTLVQLARQPNRVPVISYHLDRWWGLDRQYQAEREPFFQTDIVMTADGGHDDEWQANGTNHIWMPPAVSARECAPGMFRDEFASDLAFVGSWQGGYHSEWKHRQQLVGYLQARYGKQIKFWPKKGQPAIRGGDLRDLTASVKVFVGDSCLVGDGGRTQAIRYSSDRIPECVGRGGFLLHPHVEGVTDGTLFTPGTHLDAWQAGDFDELDRKINFYLENDVERQQIAAWGKAHVLEHHTYESRMRDVILAVEAW